MIISIILFPIFLFVSSELAENVFDPCSEFLDSFGQPMVKCPSEKPNDEYLECYDKSYKGFLEEEWSIRLMYWCWSRHDNSDDNLKNLPISAGHNYNNSYFNDIINRPFTASFFVNETHIFCLENEKWWSQILFFGPTNVYCSISTGIPVADFHYYRERSL